MELAELTVRGFTEEIASASPAPGGGSAAALAGAVGAALTVMVSGLTLGRKKYEAVQELALRAQAQADALRKRLLAAMEQDTQAFLQVSAAYAMPKQTPEEKQARSSAIEQGLKACTQPPLAVMQLCAEGLELLESLLGKTNATAASDFGVACLSLRAGMQGAWLNVCINTGCTTPRLPPVRAQRGRSCSIPAFRAPTAATRRCWPYAARDEDTDTPAGGLYCIRLGRRRDDAAGDLAAAGAVCRAQL